MLDKLRYTIKTISVILSIYLYYSLRFENVFDYKPIDFVVVMLLFLVLIMDSIHIVKTGSLDEARILYGGNCCVLYSSNCKQKKTS